MGSKFSGNLIIPDQIKIIEEEAFFQCTFNGYLTLGSELQSIGYLALSGSGSFNKIYCKAIEPPILQDDIMRSCNCKYLGVPVGSRDAYRAANYWDEFSPIEEIEF